MGIEETRAQEIEFSRKLVLLSVVWISVTIAAGVLLVLYRDAFAGVFF